MVAGVDVLSELYEKYSLGNGVTISKHLEGLYKTFKLFTFQYPNLSEREIKIILKAIYYHAAGKVSKEYQSVLQGKLKDEIIPYNYLSLFILCSSVESLKEIDEDFLVAAYIISHHRAKGKIKFFTSGLPKMFFTLNKLKEILPSELLIELDQETLKKTLNVYSYVVNNIIRKMQKEDFNATLTRLTGIFMRIHDLNSMKITEETRLPKVRSQENDKITKIFNWAKRKLFYVLPNSASTTAVYERLKNYVKEDDIGIFSSNSVFDIAKSSLTEEDLFNEREAIISLSKPIVLTTADQLFNTAFKYQMYEKIYATLSYSDVVIDEIQAFNPYQLALMIEAVQDTTKLGARYLVLSSSYPEFINEEEFQTSGIEVIIDKTNKKHKLHLVEKDIYETVKNNIDKHKNERVLVVVNTVETAQELYKKLRSGLKDLTVKLLHKRFILKDRIQKEKEILQDDKPVVWITTQIIENSFDDVSFDVLFTELASADSLLLRSKLIKNGNEIYVACKYDSKRVHKIYDKMLLEKTKELLTKHEYITSDIMRDIVNEIYTIVNIAQTEYYKAFETTEASLHLKVYIENTLRNVVNFEVIHEANLDKVKELIKQYNACQDKTCRLSILNEINALKIQVPCEMIHVVYRSKAFNVMATSGKYAKYDSELGLVGV